MATIFAATSLELEPAKKKEQYSMNDLMAMLD